MNTYTSDNPFIVDVAITESRQYLTAAATTQQNSKHSTIYSFDVQETRDSNPNFWFQTITLTIIIVGLTTLAYLLHRKQKPQKPSNTTYSTLPQQQG